MTLFPNLIFLGLLLFGVGFFTRNISRIRRNILIGKEMCRSDNKSQRWAYMIRVALGQSKMGAKPITAFLHFIVYVGFILINIELLEIVLDGLLGSHRLFAPLLGRFYDFLIGCFEVLAFLVLITVIVFWIRRNVTRIKRFWKPEMKGWPKMDADFILYFEVILMLLFLSMNASDSILQDRGIETYVNAGSFPISQFLYPLFDGLSDEVLIVFERSFWWAHIIGILIFLNYLYYSKHLHILLAFPNTYFGSLKPKGYLKNLDSVTNEVKIMMDPDSDPYSDMNESEVIDKFGASDVFDLNKIQLLNAYTCTECGRCTSECPASQTGKKLSPRKIMMDTRDRLEEVGLNIDANKGKFVSDGKQLLGDFISEEEIWACTSCNACVEACPISINPLSIILDMRRYLVMEKSAAPLELNNMMNNIENNGAPWPYNQMDRLNWNNE